MKWLVGPNGLLIAAVADGAGSARLAEIGSNVAAVAAVEAMGQHLSSKQHPANLGDEEWRLLLIETIQTARTRVQGEAEARSATAQDLATTLAVAVAGVDFLAAVQVGDGAIVAAEPSGILHSVARSAPGEYLNETIFLTSEDALVEAVPEVWRGELVHLAMLSDGLQMTALQMPGGQPHPGFFVPLFKFLANESDSVRADSELTAFLESPRLRARTDDDVTLVLATLVG
jgi:hypothetical protein